MGLQINSAKAPTVKTVPISTMKAGEVFHFTSKKEGANTGNYIRANSKSGKGLHLGTFKVIKFEKGEVGVPKDASMKID